MPFFFLFFFLGVGGGEMPNEKCKRGKETCLSFPLEDKHFFSFCVFFILFVEQKKKLQLDVLKSVTMAHCATVVIM